MHEIFICIFFNEISGLLWDYEAFDRLGRSLVINLRSCLRKMNCFLTTIGEFLTGIISCSELHLRR
jgi:hypothetical protein